MRVSTTRFGELEVPTEEIVDFPEGLPGFESKRFLVLNSTENELVAWLQSVDEPHVALLTIEPEKLVAGYKADPKPAEVHPLKLAEGDDLVVRVIVREAERAGQYYLNLFAPILLNMSRRLGMQLPLVGSGYSLRAAWPPPFEAEDTSASNAMPSVMCSSPKTEESEDGSRA